MLLERLSYADDFPMNIHIARLEEDPLHYHLDIEFLYVLKGEVLLKNGYCHYHLHEGDIFTNSGHEVHGMTALTEDNVVATIQISTHYFSQYFPNLSKACYRTYNRKAEDGRHDVLRGLLLQILLKYVLRSFNYKSECTYLMGDTLKHLDKYFNLFAFDKDVVVGFDRSNPVAVERISRICQYIYQYYAENITLEDLSEMEHLSPFYLSHLIKNFTGMNFRDFLCFARVEWSELHLLDSDKKISQIAREVGFSTTAYYRKYFQKWFGATPEEHRQKFLPRIKSEMNPARYTPLPTSSTIELVKATHANYNLKKDSSAVIENLHLELNVDAFGKALRPFSTDISVRVTLEDFRVLGASLPVLLQELAPHRILLVETGDPETDTALATQLSSLPFPVEHCCAVEELHCAANDTIAAPITLLRHILSGEEVAPVFPLRDSGSAALVLQGKPGLVSAGGIRKPLFFLCRMLSRVKGDLIFRNGDFAAIRLNEDSFFLAACHGGEMADRFFNENSDVAQVRNAIGDFKDEVSITTQMNLPNGNYTVIKYRFDKEDSLFARLSAITPPEETTLPLPIVHSLATPPTAEVYTEDVRAAFHLLFSIKGAGIHTALIQAKKRVR